MLTLWEKEKNEFSDIFMIGETVCHEFLWPHLWIHFDLSFYLSIATVRYILLMDTQKTRRKGIQRRRFAFHNNRRNKNKLTQNMLLLSNTDLRHSNSSLQHIQLLQINPTIVKDCKEDMSLNQWHQTLMIQRKDLPQHKQTEKHTSLMGF